MSAPVTGPVLDSTQVEHPWRAALRTALVTALVLVPTLGLVVPEVVQIVLEEVGARTEVPSWLRLTLLGISAAVTCAAAIVNRVALIPAINAALTRWGVGPAPAPRRALED